jgi:hypothetical protein
VYKLLHLKKYNLSIFCHLKCPGWERCDLAKALSSKELRQPVTLAFELDLTSTNPQSTQLPLRKKKLTKMPRKMIMRIRKKKKKLVLVLGWLKELESDNDLAL